MFNLIDKNVKCAAITCPELPHGAQDRLAHDVDYDFSLKTETMHEFEMMLQ